MRVNRNHGAPTPNQREHAMKKLFIALVALTLVAPILAQEPVPDELPPLGEAARNGVITFLQLTEDQIATWEGLLDTRELAMEPIRADIQAVDAAIQEQFDSGAPDALTVGELVIERHGLGEDWAEVHMTYVEDFEAMLDDVQLADLQFLRRAERAKVFIPAFKTFGLIRR
jgi:hypothetical protein